VKQRAALLARDRPPDLPEAHPLEEKSGDREPAAQLTGRSVHSRGVTPAKEKQFEFALRSHSAIFIGERRLRSAAGFVADFASHDVTNLE